jgi:hypothetical protein
MEEVDDAGFEDFSVSTTLEKVAFNVEQAINRWLSALATGRDLPDQTHVDAPEVLALQGLLHISLEPVCGLVTTIAVSHPDCGPLG